MCVHIVLYTTVNRSYECAYALLIYKASAVVTVVLCWHSTFYYLSLSVVKQHR
jgi:hypothetical protein